MKTTVALLSFLLVLGWGAALNGARADDEETPPPKAPLLFVDPATFPKPGDPDYWAKRKQIEKYRNKMFNKMPPALKDTQRGPAPAPHD